METNVSNEKGNKERFTIKVNEIHEKVSLGNHLALAWTNTTVSTRYPSVSTSDMDYKRGGDWKSGEGKGNSEHI